jgi:hypothetical protein
MKTQPHTHTPRLLPAFRQLTAGLVALLSFTVVHAQNYLRNSSFELPLGGTSNWSFVTGGGASATATTVSDEYHWEEQCVKMTFTGAQQSGVYAQVKQSAKSLTVGQGYYACIWIKGDNVGSGGTFKLYGQSHSATVSIPNGTYGWQLLQLPVVVADQTSLMCQVTISSNTGSLWIDDGYVTEHQRTDVSALGIPGNDTDVTAAIASALSTHKFLYFPAGTYKVNGSITIPIGAIIQGAGDATVFNQTANVSAIFTAFGNDSTFVGDNEYTAFKAVGGDPASSTIPSNYVAYYKTARNVLMRHCTANPCNLLYVTTHKSSYADITSESQLSADIRVSFCHATGPNAGGTILQQQDCLRFRYVTDTEIYKNTLRHYGIGVSIWGGNASFGTGSGNNGAMTNPRWARRHYIAGNISEDMTNACIFTSMGEDVVVELNTANRSGDISIDFEGCHDCIANDNVVSDGLNGALATFYGTRNVTFLRNTVTSNIAGRPLFRLYNSSYNADNVLNVVLEENTFTCTDGIAPVDDYKGPGNLTLRNNTFSNVVIDISHRGMGTSVPGPNIIDNTMDFTVSTADPVTAINLKVAAGDTVISGNTVKWLTSYGRPTKTGILYRRVLTGGQTINIDDNYLLGFNAGSVDVYHGSSNLTLNLTNNRVGSTMYVGAQGQLTLNASNNKNLSGGAVTPVWVP